MHCLAKITYTKTCFYGILGDSIPERFECNTGIYFYFIFDDIKTKLLLIWYGHVQRMADNRWLKQEDGSSKEVERKAEV
jgi:hypothetical protein